MFVSKLAVTSKNLTSSPALGLAGNVIVNAPPDVSTNNLSPATAVYVAVFACHAEVFLLIAPVVVIESM